MVNMEETKPVQVMIVGAGLGGVMLAILLERLNIPYLVFERSSEVRPLGSAMVFGANILPVFEQLGLLEEVRKISLPCLGMDIYNAKIEKVANVDVNQYRARSGYDFLMFSRPDMHHLLLAQVPPEKVLMKKRVLSIEQNEHGVMVRVADGSTYHGDILVGADGAYSGVRQGLFKLMEKKGELPESDKSSLKLGYISMVGVSHPQDPEKYPVLKEPSSNFSRVIGDGTPHSYNTVTVPGNRICWGMTMQLDTSKVSKEMMFKNSEWGPEANESMIKEIRNFPSHFGGVIGDLIDATPKEMISRVFLEEKMFETWYHGRTVLIGDACHKMLPSGGQGATNAMQDAVILANCIYDLQSNSPKHITEAFKSYKEQRYPHAKYQMDKSKTMGRVLYGQTMSDRFLRYVAFNVVPQKSQEEQFLKDTNYRPILTFMEPPENRGSGPVLPQKPSRRYQALHGKVEQRLAQLEQSFRAKSSSKIITIPTSLDNSTDIYGSVLNNGSAVLFLTDDNLAYLSPLRDGYHPGATFDVMIGSVEKEPIKTIDTLELKTMSSLPTSSGAKPVVWEPSCQHENQHVRDTKAHSSPTSKDRTGIDVSHLVVQRY
ncbi:hypothetical protein B0O80DRAFT_503426 [Mortierella sp. GBAus27b]|nr:hypothetical protein B0O80DRAFT_503426 [Mortierella sp. GBAus27b]